MKIATIIVRVLLGLGFIVFGLNILYPFLPMPPPPPEGSLPAHFFAAVGMTGWMKVVGICQLVGGLLVLSGRMAPLGLAILAPVLVNIFSFHIFLMGGEGLAPGFVFALFEIFLIYAYRNNFRGLFTTHATPTT